MSGHFPFEIGSFVSDISKVTAGPTRSDGLILFSSQKANVADAVVEIRRDCQRGQNGAREHMVSVLAICPRRVSLDWEFVEAVIQDTHWASEQQHAIKRGCDTRSGRELRLPHIYSVNLGSVLEPGASVRGQPLEELQIPSETAQELSSGISRTHCGCPKPPANKFLLPGARASLVIPVKEIGQHRHHVIGIQVITSQHAEIPPQIVNGLTEADAQARPISGQQFAEPFIAFCFLF